MWWRKGLALRLALFSSFPRTEAGEKGFALESILVVLAQQAPALLLFTVAGKIGLNFIKDLVSSFEAHQNRAIDKFDKSLELNHKGFREITDKYCSVVSANTQTLDKVNIALKQMRRESTTEEMSKAVQEMRRVAQSFSEAERKS